MKSSASEPGLRHFAKTRNRMTTAITFSRQNDADSSAQKMFALEVVLVSESKGLYFLLRDRRALVEKEMKTTSVSRQKYY